LIPAQFDQAVSFLLAWSIDKKFAMFVTWYTFPGGKKLIICLFIFITGLHNKP
jgi:hypothetical protein